MSWYEKEKPTPFDSMDIEGLYFLDGKWVEQRSLGKDVVDKKLPRIAFPSGLSHSISPADNADYRLLVSIESSLLLPYQADPHDVLHLINENSAEHGYTARMLAANELAFRSKLGWGIKVTYDPDDYHMANIELFEWIFDNPAYDYLPDQIREKLPALYSQEAKGMDAEAIVKYFTPDAGWTWYASEFDGDDIFFGLVIGHEIELGYFSFSELSQVRGALNLPIERDLDYKPKTLKELQEYHYKQRYD